LKKSVLIALASLWSLFLTAQQPSVTWDRQSLLIDGHRVVPVMGEIHYSRVPADEWRTEIRKMKEGGVTIIATYVFWNHVEEQEGIFDWSGQRDLRTFLELCRQEDMPVVLRLGPFCHGEVRCGGIPDWILTKRVTDTDANGATTLRQVKSRSEDPVFLAAVERLYRQIFTQVQGLQWKDGGPVLAAQFDNEYRGHGSYLVALKRMAERIGFDLPFYTRTGWPQLRTPVAFGEMLPLYGDYADGFWDKEITEGAGNYWKAFHFKAFRSSTAIGTDLLGKQEEKTEKGDDDYPYFTCELGGGMTTSYHRRPYIYPKDALSLAIVKLGSGSNLLGYYMYHGGTNPEGHLTTLNENQRTLATANNDLPVKSYEFQAPLGEFGQRNDSYYLLRPLHLFLNDYGETLAPMEAHFPDAGQEAVKGDDSHLRWCWRAPLSPTPGSPTGFVFVNNYERLQGLTDKHDVQFTVDGLTFPSRPVTIPAGTTCIFPFGIEGMRYATAQLVARRDGKVYLMQVKGVPTEIAIDGKVLRNVKAKGLTRPVYKNLYLIDEETAQKLFLEQQADPKDPKDLKDPKDPKVSYTKTAEAGAPRTIVKGPAKVAEAPGDSDFEQAATYVITLPADADSLLLDIDYQGDCARLYAGDQLLDDNFYNGRHFQYGLWRLPKDCRTLTLRILPLQSGMPVYLPREADTTPGERVNHITLIQP